MDGLTRVAAPNHTQVAVLVDARVVSAPQIMAVIPGDAVISGSYTKAEAQALAAELTGGVLPLTLTVLSVN